MNKIFYSCIHVNVACVPLNVVCILCMCIHIDVAVYERLQVSLNPYTSGHGFTCAIAHGLMPNAFESSVCSPAPSPFCVIRSPI